MASGGKRGVKTARHGNSRQEVFGSGLFFLAETLEDAEDHEELFTLATGASYTVAMTEEYKHITFTSIGQQRTTGSKSSEKTTREILKAGREAVRPPKGVAYDGPGLKPRVHRSLYAKQNRSLAGKSTGEGTEAVGKPTKTTFQNKDIQGGVGETWRWRRDLEKKQSVTRRTDMGTLRKRKRTTKDSRESLACGRGRNSLKIKRL